MLEDGIALLDWLGIAVFALTGALVASRHQMDVVGFMMLGTVTGIGGGTLRDVLLGIHPILWIEQPEYIGVCVAVSVVTFFTAHLVQSREKLILWFDAGGLALFAATGAERALSTNAHPIVAILMGMITACFGGIIRDTLSQQQSIIFSQEIYVSAAVASATTFVVIDSIGLGPEYGLIVASLIGFSIRGGALLYGWTLPRYRPRP